MEGGGFRGGQADHQFHFRAEVFRQDFAPGLTQLVGERLQLRVVDGEPELGEFDEGHQHGGFQGHFGGAAVGPHQAARAQFDPAEVADDRDHGVHHVEAFRLHEDGPARRAAGFARVVAVGGESLAGLDAVGEGEVVGVGVAVGDAGEAGAEFALVGTGHGEADEAGVVDGVVDFGGGLDELHGAGGWMTFMRRGLSRLLGDWDAAFVGGLFGYASLARMPYKQAESLQLLFCKVDDQNYQA